MIGSGVRMTCTLRFTDSPVRLMQVTVPSLEDSRVGVGCCQFARAAGSSIPRNSSGIRAGSQLRAAGLSDGVPEFDGKVWCELCGDRRGWCTCGRCMGEGAFPTQPGLAGVKGKVGWARCKTCFGRKVVPCLFCGTPEASNSVEAWARRCLATFPSNP